MNNTNPFLKTGFIPLFIFAVSMGFLEAIVVVYVRELYYPGGFDFPLKMLPQWLVFVEIVRELCTLLMLGSVAWISGKSFLQRLSVFLFTFGVWDIIYYVALKIFLDWPESLFTWDILFLIPITWTGPVLAPVICSVVMILMAFLFEHFRQNKKTEVLKLNELLLMIAGSAVIYFTFTYDIGTMILKGNYLGSFFTLAENDEFLNELSTYVPDKFLWEIFVAGLLMILFGNLVFVKRNLQ
jgi:hypothetical protein